MKAFINFIVMLLFTSILTSCSDTVINGVRGCPDAIIEWVDIVMINDIKYQHQFPDTVDEKGPIDTEKGKEIGKVSIKMADKACKDYKLKNGDAAYLEIGTPIYEVKGYPSSFIIMANDELYVANQNKKAITAGELYPIRGLLKNIHIESTDDGKRIHTFNLTSTEQFVNEWYKLKLENHDSLYKKQMFEGERIFLEIELNNGYSFRILYWKNTNTFHFGAVGNDEIQEIITNELLNVKSH